MSIEIRPAEDRDIDEISALVNSAYRGESSRAGWSTEEELIGGQRTDPDTLRKQLSGDAIILCLRRAPEESIEACVYLKKTGSDCYLGMLTVKPGRQARGAGRHLLAYGEDYARQWNCRRVVMTVLSVREALIAWYERRGYGKTGETEPFPYGDERFGIPKVEGLYFLVLAKTL